MLKLYAKLAGGLAQLARAPALHAGGQRFESVILHFKFLNYDVIQFGESFGSSPTHLQFRFIEKVL
jgi:hypothetical protein